MHVVIEPHEFIWVRVMALRKEDQMTCKVRLAIQRTDALNHVTVKDLVDLATDYNFVRLELGTCCWELINKNIHLGDGLVRKAKPFTNLSIHVSITTQESYDIRLTPSMFNNSDTAVELGPRNLAQRAISQSSLLRNGPLAYASESASASVVFRSDS